MPPITGKTDTQQQSKGGGIDSPPAVVYYDWAKTFTFNADVSVVIAQRGDGKTYGLRVEATKDYQKHGFRFVEICRYKNELSAVMDGYFDKIADEFPDYVFQTHSGKGYIAKKPPGGKKPKWELICYFVALSDAQNAKKRTYKNVRKLIFDEAILERTDRFHRYVPNEYARLANIVDTTTREKVNSTVRPHLYLLGNACDLMNPYFQQYGINTIPEFGYHWYRNKTVLLHYKDPGETAQAKLDNTVSGRMTKGTAEGEIAAHNRFQTADQSLIGKKPKNAEYVCAFIDEGSHLGVWSDNIEGYFYITSKTIEDKCNTTYYITRTDASLNRLQAHRATPAIQALRDAHRLSCIKYETLSIYEKFQNMLAKFGL